jgi:hypothetical protein
MEEVKSTLVKCIDCVHLNIDDGCFYCNELSPCGTRLSVTLHHAHSCLKFTDKRKLIKINNTSNRCCICKYFRPNTGMCHNLENARLIGNEIILGAFLKGPNQVTDVALKGNYCCDYFEEYELPF